MKCECCKVREATRIDYRSYSGNTTKYRVCEECLHLNDVDFKKLKDSTNEIINSGKWYCPECLSTDVEVKMWAKINDETVTDYFESTLDLINRDQEEIFCPNCGNKIEEIKRKVEKITFLPKNKLKQKS